MIAITAAMATRHTMPICSTTLPSCKIRSWGQPPYCRPSHGFGSPKACLCLGQPCQGIGRPLPAQMLPPPMERKARPQVGMDQAGGPGQEGMGAPISPQQLRDPAQILFLVRLLLEVPVYPP